MKKLYWLIAFLLCYSCNRPQENRADSIAQEMNILNDSILNLMFEFNKSDDTAFINRALAISDRMIAMDTNKEYEFRNINLRAPLLCYLGRYKESFELVEPIYNKYGSDIDRRIRKGVRYKIEGKNDSIQYCLNIALEQCNDIVADSIFIVYKMAEIYLIMDRKSEIKRMIEELSIKYPDKVDELNLALEKTDIIEKHLSLVLDAYKNAANSSD